MVFADQIFSSFPPFFWGSPFLITTHPHSGSISIAEFLSLMRRDAKLTLHQMDDASLVHIFHRYVDEDGSGDVDLEEFVRKKYFFLFFSSISQYRCV